MFGLIFSLLIGALAGYIAGRIMGSETSAVRNIGRFCWQHPVQSDRPECHGPCGRDSCLCGRCLCLYLDRPQTVPVSV